jgi:hypothetical protein
LTAYAEADVYATNAVSTLPGAVSYLQSLQHPAGYDVLASAGTSGITLFAHAAGSALQPLWQTAVCNMRSWPPESIHSYTFLVSKMCRST